MTNQPYPASNAGPASSRNSDHSHLPLPGNIRRSKIGRLPTEIRHLLNQWIRESIPYETISDRLAKLNHPGITAANLSTWNNGGHLLWLRDQEAADQLRENANRLTDILAEMEGDTADKCARLGEQMAAIQIAQMLHAVDPKTGNMLLQENHDLFFRLVRALTVQTHERTRIKKIELEQRKYNDYVDKLRIAERNAVEKTEKNRSDVTQEELDMLAGAWNISVQPPDQLARTVNKYRLLQYRIKREAEERARRNDWDNTEVSPDPYVAAIERGEDPFATTYGPPLPHIFCSNTGSATPVFEGRDDRAASSSCSASHFKSEISNLKSEISATHNGQLTTNNTINTATETAT